MSDGARIHPTAIVAEDVRLGASVEIGPFCTIGPQVELGDGVRLISHVHIEGLTSIGAGTVVYPFATLGTPGQDLSYRGEATTLEIGARCTIREHASLQRGTARGRGFTRVGDDCYFMAQTHVAHDVIVGNGAIFAQSAIVAGHCVVGDNVTLGGLAAVHQKTRIGRYAYIGGLAAVVGDVIPFATALGNHAELAGFNLVGFKRRGYGRKQIHDLRAAWRMLFEGDAPFSERLAQTAETFPEVPEVQEVVAFIRADASRPLCLPRR